MNGEKELLLENLNEILIWLKNMVTAGGEIIKDNAPTVIKEIIAYERATTTVVFLIFLAVIICGIILVRHKNNDYEGNVICKVFGVTIILIGTFTALFSMLNLIKAYTSPTLIVLDYVKGLV